MRYGLAALVVPVAVIFAAASCGTLSGSGDTSTLAPTPDASADGASATDGSGTTGDASGSDGATPPKTYLSCGDAQIHGVTADGDVLVDIDGPGGPRQPITVYCAQMAGGGEADAYLPLAHVTSPTTGDAFANGKNVSCWRSGGSCSGGDVVRAYTKVRLQLDTSPMHLYIGDATFSTTNRAATGLDTGPCDGFGTPAYNYGVASGCAPSSSPGRGNVDLTDTPFHVLVDETGMGNGGSVGTTTYATDASGRRKIVETTSGGDCGHQFPGHASNTLDIDFD